MTKKTYNIGNQNAAKENRKDCKIEIRCTAAEKKNWEKEADKAGITRAAWVRDILNAAIK